MLTSMLCGHLSSKNPCTTLEGRLISPPEPRASGWHRLCLPHFEPCTASAPALHVEGAQHGPELRPQQKDPQPHSSPSPRGAHSFQAEGGVGSVCVVDVPLAVVPGKEPTGRLASKVPAQVPGSGETDPGTACGALCGCCPSCLP